MISYFNITLLFILLSQWFFFCKSEDSVPIVETPLGLVKGFTKTSHGGRQYSAFEGIPFAKPPVGARRFQPPEAIEPWHGTWDATFPTICAQNSMMPPHDFIGTENCLHINVYVPQNQSSNSKLPVLVHIHGGAFMWGHGNSYTSPLFLMDHNVIFVTFNYRLGVLGFLSTEDDVVPGNMGLKDQVLALKWVQKNIKSFGGNSDSVTLFGLSAGGGSTHIHYFSDMSKGLFHRGFAQSGVAINHWMAQENPLQNARFIANAAGCATNSNKLMVECLKERPVKQIVDKIALLYKYLFMPIVPFGPVVEKGGSEPFVKELSYKSLIEKKIIDVPFIASHTSHEGLFPTIFFKNDLEEINDNWLDWAPFFLDFNHTALSSRWNEISTKIKDSYIGPNKDINLETFSKFSEIFSDRYFCVGIENAALLQSAATESPVYHFKFNYPGDFSGEKTVAHGGDAMYYFGSIIGGARNLTENELKMKDVLVGMLVSYAETGVPSLKGVSWPATDSNQLIYADINGYSPQDIEIITKDNFKSSEFWKSLKLNENENIENIKDEL